MMSLTNGTAMIIASRDDLIYSHAGPDGTGKYAGWINMPSGRPLLNTTNIFDTAELAEKHMTDLRDDLAKRFNAQ